MNDNYNPSHNYPLPESDGNYKLSIRQITDCKSFFINFTGQHFKALHGGFLCCTCNLLNFGLHF